MLHFLLPFCYNFASICLTRLWQQILTNLSQVQLWKTWLLPACCPAVLIASSDSQRQLEQGVAWPSPGSKFWEASPRTNPMPVDVGAGSSSVQPRDSRSLDVVHFTAELAPIAKVSNCQATGSSVQCSASCCDQRLH
jgi:hypothetical protein